MSPTCWDHFTSWLGVKHKQLAHTHQHIGHECLACHWSFIIQPSQYYLVREAAARDLHPVLFTAALEAVWRVSLWLFTSLSTVHLHICVVQSSQYCLVLETAARDLHPVLLTAALENVWGSVFSFLHLCLQSTSLSVLFSPLSTVWCMRSLSTVHLHICVVQSSQYCLVRETAARDLHPVLLIAALEDVWGSVLVFSSSSSSSAFPAISLGFTILLNLHSPAIFLGFTLDEIFAYVTVFYSKHWGSHILSS